MPESQPCDRCAGPTSFTAQLSPLGSEPGHRIHFCSACQRHTWTTWQFTPQQQQQPQAKER
jgi:hypothetical protein